MAKPRIMRRFFPYFGGKHKSIALYPTPEQDIIIEPFAGSAGYSTRYPGRQVILGDRDERICSVWSWLINVSEDVFMALPTFEGMDSIPPLGPEFSKGARYFLRLWASTGKEHVWGRNDRISALSKRNVRVGYGGWDHNRKVVLASQLKRIRHWRVYHTDWEQLCLPRQLENEITWFVDPPYSGKRFKPAYQESASEIGYRALSAFCTGAAGQVIVCESLGADWLPFKRLHDDPGRVEGSNEVLWAKQCKGGGRK